MKIEKENVPRDVLFALLLVSFLFIRLPVSDLAVISRAAAAAATLCLFIS